MIINYSLAFFLISYLATLVQPTPEKPDCEWVPEGEVTRMRDTSDCSKYYYCQKGLKPYRMQCPQDVYGYYLYFVPNTTECDTWTRAPKDCFSEGSGDGGSYTYVYEPPTTTTTTTEATTTTTRAPKPPKLEETPDFEIDCGRKFCGLFPNAYGPCDTYVICVNGNKLEKKCNGGQLFDVKTRECQPASQATCWTEPDAGPHIRAKSQEECPFHGNAASTPIETEKNAIVLQNPVVTDWGTWQEWEECPSGMYATGIYAWRRLLQQGWQIDQAGITALSFICQTPGGNETDDILESLAPGLPRDGWPFYYMCRGAAVGIRLNSVSEHGWGNDELATDNVQAMCSCSAPAYKSYDDAKYAPQNGDRGVWTAPQYCKKGQAICGMQAQMQDYKEYLLGRYDNTGMNNIKVKCCDVPNPMDKCVPKEDRLFIRECDNSKSDEQLRCDFDAMIGVSMDYDNNQRRVDFYSSIGYTFNDAKKQIPSRIENKLIEQLKQGIRLEYDWDDMAPGIMDDADEMKVTSKTMYVKEYEKVELYQIVGRCDHFLVRSNRYVKVIKDGKTGRTKQQSFFEI